MMLAAGQALGEKSPALADPSASLLPRVRDLRDVAAHIAIAVGRQAQRDGVAPETSDAALRERVGATQWTPAYPSFAPSVEA
jgi:malate dehydrogenase (oxaloacetate-decarboxylating)